MSIHVAHKFLKHHVRELKGWDKFPKDIIPDVDSTRNLGALPPNPMFLGMYAHYLYAHDDGGLAIGVTEPNFAVGGPLKDITWYRHTGTYPNIYHYIWDIKAFKDNENILQILYGSGEEPLYMEVMKLEAAGPVIWLDGLVKIYTYPDIWHIAPTYPDRDLVFKHEDYTTHVVNEIFRLRSGLSPPFFEPHTDIVPDVTDTLNLGSSSKRFLELYCKGYADHKANPSAHHTKTTTFPEITGEISDSQHGTKTTIPNAHHDRNHNLGATDHPDVEISTPADKQALMYEAATSKWKNKDVPYPTQSYAHNEALSMGFPPGQTTTICGITIPSAGDYYISSSGRVFYEIANYNQRLIDFTMQFTTMIGIILYQVRCMQELSDDAGANYFIRFSFPFFMGRIRACSASEVIQLRCLNNCPVAVSGGNITLDAFKLKD